MDRKFFKPVPRSQHRDEDLSRIIYDFIALLVIFPKRFSWNLVDSFNIQIDRDKKSQDNFKGEIRLSLSNINFIISVF